ncbi:hypothetical protein LXA43DRAFT_906912, partial [Ganoderma leucocontextum]
DQFFEQCSLHNIKCNAMVAVFLRHIKYFRGILFMTTTDKVSLSRIDGHVAQHFTELSVPTKVQIWQRRTRGDGARGRAAGEEARRARHQCINQRQIKTVCNMATSLAASCGEKMRYEHSEQALNAMEEFI